MEELKQAIKEIQKAVQKVADVMELIIALSVALALVVVAARYIPSTFRNVLSVSEDTAAFYKFIEEIFLLVIGIEFIKMLCQPDAHNVIEVLLFLIARHMIVGHNSAVDNLMSVISIAILFLMERYLQNGTLRNQNRTREEIDKGEQEDESE